MNALWWWIDRWRKSTAYTDMTLEEQGAYRNLLDEATLRGGPLPDDDRILAKACGDATAWKRVRRAVMARFHRTEDGWRNETLDKVIRASAGRADRQRRWRESLARQGRNDEHNDEHNNERNDARNDDHNPQYNSDRNTGRNSSRNEAHSPDPDPDLVHQRG